ncbi:hypothetical protein AX16_000410 [Volvariella volvacea WC 439]|nr:hypothetical protein AX16_000410 [Volvariella volvacea WC 439]
MRRPKPLSNITTGRRSPADFHNLTPRTPHTKSGLAEEAYSEIELEQVNDEDEDDYRGSGQESKLLQVPLLSRSRSTSPSRSRDNSGTGYRSRGDDYDATASSGGIKKIVGGLLDPSVVLSRLPLAAGVSLAGFLLVLIFLSIKKPDTLQSLVNPSQTPASPINSNAGDSVPTPTRPSKEDAYKHVLSSSWAAQTSAAAAVKAGEMPHHTSGFAISYENYTQFPLRPNEYLTECSKIMHGYMSHGDYWDDPMHGLQDVAHHDVAPDYTLPEGEVNTVCKSTITYMLDGTVGLLADLALMAQTAALARERNRTFLIDDTYWNRGKWTDYFQDVLARQPGPEPGCRAPPPEELVACPRTARHWVINARTAKYHFGHPYSNHYENAYGHSLNRLKPIFESGRQSFQETIRPNAEMAQFIRTAREELADIIKARLPHSVSGSDSLPGGDLPYLSVHVRRGDRKPLSYTFLGAHIPISNYADAVKKAWPRIAERTLDLIVRGSHPLSPNEYDRLFDPIVYFASDSPDAIADFLEYVPQTGPLTSIFSLSRSKHRELRALASPGEYYQKEFDLVDESTRIRATKGMIVDFALMSGMWAWENDVTPRAVVCGISSNPCKVAPMGLGWDVAFGSVDSMGNMNETTKGWYEIDQRGNVMPVWQAFELFF